MRITVANVSARRVRVACALLLFAGAASAQAPAPALDPNVAAVVQAGRWQEAGVGEGSYRVVVVNAGFEHVSSRVVAEWKRDAGEGGDASIVHSAELVAPGSYSLGAPTLAASKDGVHVELTGVATHAPDTRIVCKFALTPGGKVAVTKACGD